MADSKILECSICRRRYGLEDVEAGLYQAETLTCSACYADMQRAPHDLHCFGKPTVILPSGKHLLGYNPKAEECSHLCKDRNVCRRIVWPEP